MSTGSDQTPPRRILSEARLDDLGDAIIALTRELWVLSDRQMVLEAVLAEQGIDTARIDGFQPDEALTEKLAAGRERLLATVLAALKAG